MLSSECSIEMIDEKGFNSFNLVNSFSTSSFSNDE